MARTILVTGAAGFVGSAVVRALSGTAPLRLLLHQSADRAHAIAIAPPGTDVHYGDLTAPATLEGLCEGVHTVVHLAHLTGDDEERCRAVNDAGTRALLSEARYAGADRIIYLSTTEVYGNASYCAAVEADLHPAPVTPTGRSQLRAEELVRNVGGIVLRPHLIYGTGDAGCLPRLISVLRIIGGIPDGGPALQSVIGVDDLARLVAALAHKPWYPGPADVFHAGHPEPISVADLARAVARTLSADLSLAPVPLGQAGLRLRSARVPLRELTRISQSHWSDATAIWRRTGLTPGEPFATGLARHAIWYGSLPAIIPLDRINDERTVRLPP